MIIDTRTKKNMESSLSDYLGIKINDLCQYINYALCKSRMYDTCYNMDIFDEEIARFYSELKLSGTIDEIYVYHLTRRLNSSIDDLSSDNLKSLLLDESAISSFLRKHEVSFKLSEDHPLLFYKGKEVKLTNTMETNVRYLRSRLGYNSTEKDYCFNGFAFRDLLLKNSYASELYYGPEFIVRLSDFLNDTYIAKDYFDNSSYFCLTYIMKFEDIVFDSNELFNYNEKIKYFVMQMFNRLSEYTRGSRHLDDFQNPIIRLSDTASVSANNFVDKEEINRDMLVTY
ncbi:hypothetical protein [Ruminococcus sp.]|uniref:hypothetical protein n=1 Tax=Ruminococcus sp. TaxID=41978 RepID=UPI0025DF95BE|nr:hypothetical protein [Ruminococcus sp.]MBR1433259.1 hypothetical protein [Ruminococcus sp.]